ncbi:hypothetical protein [Sinosporangium siamense]|uniref:Uncharacterized protein n=1 Tax=Sinosporangium siamense TaxID=1367973 RepID=A0A919RM95_9ACTN|nr:hypothetical protein [Sinosporangium siamense]GII94584.1 hypothetical protein Ssi02_48150 [Sinosporangium siamense]
MNLFKRLWKRLTSPAPVARRHVCEEDYNPIALTHRFLQPPPMPCDHPSGEGLHVRDEPLTIDTPASGDALTFKVTLWSSWCAQPKEDLSADDLRAEINTSRQKAQGIVDDLVRTQGRRFEAYLPAEAEAAMEEALSVEFLAPVHDCDNVVVKCSVRVRVALCEEVLPHQREVSIDLMKSHGELRKTSAQVVLMSGQRDLWVNFLEQSATNWRGRYAVQLAENPRNVAEAIKISETERHERVEQFIQLANNVANNHRSTNLYDYVISSESALRTALERLGVPVPELTSTRPWDRP